MYAMCNVIYAVVVFSICTSSFLFFFKQKTAYEMRISDWSSDVCSSDLHLAHLLHAGLVGGDLRGEVGQVLLRVAAGVAAGFQQQIGRASCRERVCQYV